MQDIHSNLEQYSVLHSIAFNPLLSTKHTLNSNLGESLNSLCIAQLMHQSEQSIIALTNDHGVGQLYDDLKLLGLEDKVYIFFDSADKSKEVYRSKVLSELALDRQGIFLFTPESISEDVPDPKEYTKHKIELTVGEDTSQDIILDFLEEFVFERVDFVEKPGQFALRGSIIDIFSHGNQYPYRIDYDFDTIKSIRQFEIEDQRSVKEVNFLRIFPSSHAEQSKVSLEQYIPSNSILYVDREVHEQYTELPEHLSTHFDYRIVNSFSKSDQGQNLDWSPQVAFNHNFDQLAQFIQEYQHKGYNILFQFNSTKQQERVLDILQDKHIDVDHQIGALSSGYIDHATRSIVLVEHQFLDRYRKSSAPKGLKTARMAIKEFTQLKVGDLVSHIDHGIGQFAGLHTVSIGNREREAFKLKFKGGDFIYVSVHSLHKISKFNQEGDPDKLVSKLGSNTWKKAKQKAKVRIKKLAFSLVQLYAQRKMSQGVSFPPDDHLMNELESTFIFEETPDQYNAIEAVKRDMESKTPMDRLVCGDVGFGKTEVAMRAALKAITGGKQVIVLVPTTVLAFQHFNSFKKRLAPLGCEIEYLSRMRTAKQKTDIAKRLLSGQIDIVIATHMILNEKFKFKDLGLLIVDEEQKFGVGVKEKLKNIKVNLDTLSLTATPIPRTLQMSLLNIRDMSVIRTPPINRQAIHTEIQPFNIEQIAAAIEAEMSRDGQVYVIHNRVSNIEEIAHIIQTAVPDARVIFAHGQMPPKDVENRVLDFMAGKHDVFISTTIIENGIDIPNANTIIINNAQAYGLSELHQLRGRVGRSNRRAYCYLISPPLSSLNEEAKKRLQVLVEFNDPGSGFHISMRDLEIRGAGDIMGADQSGFISEMGLETYQELIREAMLELKDQEEFKDIDALQSMEVSCTVEFGDNLFIPADYIENTSERIAKYMDISGAKNEADLRRITLELSDKFGAIPPEIKSLFDGVRIKWICNQLRFDKLRIIKDKAIISIYKPSQIQGHVFDHIMQYIASHPQTAKIESRASKESNEEIMVITLSKWLNLIDLKNILSKLNEKPQV